MQLITRWDKAKTLVAERQKWYSQHVLAEDDEIIIITKKLLELGPNPHPDKVDEIIGRNRSWTALVCYECDKQVNEVVEMGSKEDPLDDDVGPQYFCAECILKALQLIRR